MKIGREIIEDYCRNVQCHDIDHLSNCEDLLIILRDMTEDQQRSFGDMCITSYGIDEDFYTGDCFDSTGSTEEFDNKSYEEQSEICIKCWKRGLSAKFNEGEELLSDKTVKSSKIENIKEFNGESCSWCENEENCTYNRKAMEYTREAIKNIIHCTKAYCSGKATCDYYVRDNEKYYNRYHIDETKSSH